MLCITTFVALITLGSLDADFRALGSASYGFSLHILAYTALTLVAGLMFRNILAIGVSVFLFSLVLEALQHFMPWRHVDIQDIAGNAIGVIIGATALLVLRRSRSRLSN